MSFRKTTTFFKDKFFIFFRFLLFTTKNFEKWIWIVNHIFLMDLDWIENLSNKKRIKQQPSLVCLQSCCKKVQVVVLKYNKTGKEKKAEPKQNVFHLTLDTLPNNTYT